jgi:hypothetical protein
MTMILHKEDASEMWCPHARVKAKAMDAEDGAQVTINRDEDGNSGIATRCLGPECMAWRWSNKHNEDEEGANVWGYCGLAGAP